MAKEAPKAGQTFQIFSGDEKTDAHSLMFEMAADYLGRALMKKGLVPVEKGKTPDLNIKLRYGYGKAQTQYFHNSATTYYPLHVVVLAYKEEQEVWHTNYVSAHPTSDLRYMLPRMIAVGAPDLGVDIETAKEIDFDPAKVDPDKVLPK